MRIRNVGRVVEPYGLPTAVQNGAERRRNKCFVDAQSMSRPLGLDLQPSPTSLTPATAAAPDRISEPMLLHEAIRVSTNL
jgi:hypothetical protein